MNGVGSPAPGDYERPPPPSASTLALPRILCLHGGGTNARIFHMQCRGLSHRLLPHFRLVFAEAPLPSTAGPDVLSVYAECGPFKRWVVTAADPNAVERRPRETWDGIAAALAQAMDEDDGLGATGEWAAVLGFSQGAKVAASVLLMQQERPGLSSEGHPLGRVLQRPPHGSIDDAKVLEGPHGGFRFGVLMAGRAPLLPYDWERASWLGAGERFDELARNRAAGRALRVPTLHVHGLQDPGLGYHQVLLEEWCEPGAARLVEWDGDHRLPIKSWDVKAVVDVILEMAAQTGVGVKAR